MAVDRGCALCAHADRAALDALLVANAAGVVSEVARRSGVSRTSVRRHRDAGHHLPIVPVYEHTFANADDYTGNLLPCACGAQPPIDRRTGKALPPLTDTPEGDPSLLDLVAELAREEIPTLPTRQRPGARRMAGDLTREATRRRVDALVVIVERFLEEASADEYAEDLSGRARLVTACKGALELLGKILGVIGGGEELTRALAQIEAIYETLMDPAHRPAAEAVRDRLRVLEQEKRR